MRIDRSAISWILLAACLAAAVAWLRMPAPGAPVIRSPPPLPATASPVAAAPNPAVPAPSAAREPSLAEQVDRLIATRDPKNAMAAYRLLADCTSFNRDGDRVIFDLRDVKTWNSDGALPGIRGMTVAEKAHDATLCAGMTERMRRSRIDYLAIAAQAGVEGAAIQMATEGPFGDPTALATRPNDPLVQEWKTRVLAQLRQAAENGDLGVLEYLSIKYLGSDTLFDQDPALSYRYGVAKGLIYRDLLGADSDLPKVYAPEGAQMTAIGAALSPEQRAEQLAAARRIADLARRHREQAGANLKGR